MINTKHSYLYKFCSVLNYTLIISSVMTLSLILIFFSEAISIGVLNGIKTCVNTLIPSLLPFMILSSFIIKSGLSEKIGVIISPITKFLFNLPGSTGATITLSFIGGYPIGANGIHNLFEKKIINREQALRMLSFCVGAGPAFIINVVGFSLLKNTSVGIIIFISQLLASVLIGILQGIYSRFQKNIVLKEQKTDLDINNILDSFVTSCVSSSDSLINMCMFVVIFSAIISLIYNTDIQIFIANLCINTNLSSEYLLCIISSLLEVTTGCIQSVRNLLPIEFLAFAVSWAGVCVHFQILFSIRSLNIPYYKFILQRIFHSIISVLICHYILSLYQYHKSVFSNTCIAPKPLMYSNLNACINLFLLCAIFIATLIIKIGNKTKN